MTACDRERGMAGLQPQRGFTYIWVLLLIALMGVGMTIAADVQSTSSQRDKEKELLAIGRQFRTALASYYEARLPTSVAASTSTAMAAAQQVFGLPPAAGGGAIPDNGGQHALPPRYDLHGYPTSLEELLKDDRFPGIRRHLRKIFVDPMTGKAEWGLVMVSGRIVGIHSLSTSVPIKQAGFESEDQSFSGKQSYAEWIFGPINQIPLPPGGAAPGATPDAPLAPLTMPAGLSAR
ncbi:MAG: type II secretion system GspH family protein [Betaproteobacteria bacterium]|nr:type II secretion system GspH family protein [Betaproteobacteria bacterium]